MSGRRILLVAHLSPPSTLSAARRVAGLTRHLSALGHQVTVLTSVVAGTGPVAGAHGTVRTRDLMVSPLNWRRAGFDALAGASDADYDASPSVFASVLVPDLEVVGWLPFALRRALRLAREHAVECAITTSPPRSAHLVGLALQARGVPWIADFRDGWTFDVPDRPRYPTAMQRALDRRLETTVARRANAVVGVTPPITDDLRDRLGARATTITNGFDPADVVLEADRAPLRADRFSLVYTGSLAYGGSSPEPVLRGMEVLRRDRPEMADRLEMVFAGAISPAERAALNDPRLGGAARTLGTLPREKTLALQRAADALLLVAPDRRPSVATGKLFEYLAAGRPILVLGPSSVAARIVREASAGIAVPDDDPKAVAGALAQLLAHEVPPPRRAAAERFSYARLAGEMADVVEAAISQAGAAAGPTNAAEHGPRM